jgi:hypothetical protein
MERELSERRSETLPSLDFLHKDMRALLTGYVFIGTLLLDGGLYYFCWRYFDILPLKPSFFIFKLTQGESFPAYGYLLCLLPATAASLFTYLSCRSRNPSVKVMTFAVGQIAALALSMTVLPGTVVLFFLHLALGVIVAFVACSGIVIWGGQDMCVGSRELRRETLRMRHQRLTLLLSQFIWGAGTLLIGALTVLVAALALFLTNPGVKWELGTTEQLLFMIHDFAFVMLCLVAYYLAGLATWIAIPAYLELIRIEDLAGDDL